jgi:hypothetical protein
MRVEPDVLRLQRQCRVLEHRHGAFDVVSVDMGEHEQLEFAEVFQLRPQRPVVLGPAQIEERAVRSGIAVPAQDHCVAFRRRMHGHFQFRPLSRPAGSR